MHLRFITSASFCTADIRDILSGKIADGRRITVAGMVNGLKVRQLKNGNRMASAVLEDKSGSISLTVFANVLNSYGNLLSSGSPLVITGKVSESDDKEPELICERVEIIPDSAKSYTVKKSVKPGLYLRIKSLESQEFEKIKQILTEHHGTTPVYIYCTDSGKKLEAPLRCG